MLPMHSVAQIAAEGIVSSLALGMVVATIAWLLMRVLPSGNARLRFAGRSAAGDICRAKIWW